MIGKAEHRQAGQRPVGSVDGVRIGPRVVGNDLGSDLDGDAFHGRAALLCLSQPARLLENEPRLLLLAAFLYVARVVAQQRVEVGLRDHPRDAWETVAERAGMEPVASLEFAGLREP